MTACNPKIGWRVVFGDVPRRLEKVTFCAWAWILYNYVQRWLDSLRRYPPVLLRRYPCKFANAVRPAMEQNVRKAHLAL